MDDVEDGGQFVLEAITLFRLEAKLDHLFSPAIIHLRGLGLTAQGADDVHLGSQYGVDHRSVPRRQEGPCRPGVAAEVSLGNLIQQFEDAAFAVPFVGEAVNDQRGVSRLFSRLDAFDEPLRPIGRGKVQHIELGQMAVEAG